MLSLNEVGGTVLKAARGAGLPLGTAEDLAQVAVYLIGLGGRASVITAALQEPQEPAQVAWRPEGVTVTAGSGALVASVVRDAFAMGLDRATLADAAHLELVGATLAQAGIALHWDGLTLSRSETEVLQPPCKPVKIPDPDWQVWSALAARTYVPESEASRLAGAGAGLSDND